MLQNLSEIVIAMFQTTEPWSTGSSFIDWYGDGLARLILSESFHCKSCVRRSHYSAFWCDMGKREKANAGKNVEMVGFIRFVYNAGSALYRRLRTVDEMIGRPELGTI